MPQSRRKPNIWLYFPRYAGRFNLDGCGPACACEIPLEIQGPSAEKSSPYECYRAESMRRVRNNGIFNWRSEFPANIGHQSVDAAADIAREELGRDITVSERRLIKQRLA